MSRAEPIMQVTKAIALAPHRVQYYETRAIYQFDLRAFSDALADIDKAISINDREKSF